MGRKFNFMAASCALILAILACNAPASQSNTQPDYVATITAEAALIPQTGGSQPTDTSVSSQALTGTPSTPMAGVTQTTNCRTGPGTSYDIVTSLNPGQSAVVVGKDPADNYWVINNPDGSGTCWLWGQYATVTGNTNGLPQVAPPAPSLPKFTKTPKPTKTPSVTQTPNPTATNSVQRPAGPNAPTGSMSCTKTIGVLGLYTAKVTIGMGWRDNATNEDGYHIYRDGTLIATLPPNSTSYTDSFSIGGLGVANQISATYTIAAFNSAGDSDQLQTPYTIALSSCQ